MDTEKWVHIPDAILIRHKAGEIMPLPVAGKKLEVMVPSEVTEKG